ncbi:MAG TPA: 2-oxoacid:acceptor oxidoreductase family protein [Thermoleophilia bacterium]|nr:2-oxoacid:acceptor oxidoreductase family protein [Thermoleophilia bacterium]
MPTGRCSAVPVRERGAGAVRLEVRLTGSGGQGLILAATVLAEALVNAGKEVVETQSYGPEARGGASRAEIVVSDEEIDYPEVTAPDVTLCLSQEAFDGYAAETRQGGVVLYDRDLVSPRPLEGVRLVGLPFSDAAEHELGRVVVANVVALGALLAVTGLVSPDALREALARRMPARSVELNLKALDVGLALREGAVAAG